MSEMNTRIPAAFYPGTFDPVTEGHLDIIRRGARLFGRLIVGVAENAGKNPLLSLPDRLACLEEVLPGIAAQTGTQIEAVSFSTLLTRAMQDHGASVILRGLRNGTDLDYESPMARLNTRLAPGIETVFLVAGAQVQDISSGLVREIARHGGDITSFAPPGACQRVRAALGKC
ncbi:pantetheine-phosphate adenylyltransferase [Acetobacter sp. AN02]|uniref:pantetheine-phosphate adenylyltransferase n=1 Tax=Acetobacter sp. AN02 TaxID=2894186 RepID=UPI0024342D0B|nr:pantetheine-phosphate adenylyltransferase [Acetobacter sp. AN02]MDG6094809.1 pantetheine-phosphate adenylyltransferase [Acetobacter sp. AN02]